MTEVEHPIIAAGALLEKKYQDVVGPAASLAKRIKDHRI